MNLYDTLEISKNEKQSNIKAAFHKKIKKCHPDVGGDPEEFKKVKHAYDILSDPNKRTQYNKTGYINPDKNKLIRNSFDYIKIKVNMFLDQQFTLIEYDIIKHFQTQIKKEHLFTKQEILKKEKEKKNLKYIENKFKKKGLNNHDPISDLFVEKFIQIDECINDKLEHLEMLIFSLDIISDYEFDFIKFLGNQEI